MMMIGGWLHETLHYRDVVICTGSFLLAASALGIKTYLEQSALAWNKEGRNADAGNSTGLCHSAWRRHH